MLLGFKMTPGKWTFDRQYIHSNLDFPKTGLYLVWFVLILHSTTLHEKELVYWFLSKCDTSRDSRDSREGPRTRDTSHQLLETRSFLFASSSGKGRWTTDLISDLLRGSGLGGKRKRVSFSFAPLTAAEDQFCRSPNPLPIPDWKGAATGT